ncbi:DUF2182 domain-containing protein [Ferruginivarius sediminum]|uniref:DUF2182 domain-containing protein n=1 Tax=Ferruginivarius sediminum TaxID=2661937 RepID=A0A369TCB3_9PROT|nr:DUF2182 domain-containing protein [Ferruginivarius sediminum]RDD62973.1 DUF2182 domain-containing protein [Ferruginivarius sediminum]
MTGTASPLIESALKRDRVIVLALLVAITAIAWAYLIDMAMGQAMGGMRAVSWDLGYFAAMFAMWAIMMTGMMVPSAAPLILLYAAIERKRHPGERPYAGTMQFTLGYLVTWTGFSLFATLAQWGLSEAALLSPMMVGTSPVLGAALFIAAGVYQLTPLKNTCLKHCRSPIAFLLHRRRTGRFGPLLMGLDHGAFCVGCCWFLMALLFTLGVMNLLWVVAITVFVLLEKVVPQRTLLVRVSSALMIGSGVLLLATS